MPKYQCVVGGEKFLGQGEGGQNTEVGMICDHCLPAYQRAVDVFHEQGGVSNIRNFVNAKLGDASFVEESVREDSRVRILGIVDGALSLGDSVYAHQDATALKRAILRNVDLEAFKQISSGGAGLKLEAAMACMNEEQRTFGFIKVLAEYLKEMEKDREKIEVVDAGCGPIPLFGLIAALKSPKARVTCVEINPASCQMAKHIVEKLGLSDRVEVKLADAAQYQHGAPIDLLVSETMYAGLTTEPMVQILDNLVPQVAEGGAVIPEHVDICAGIMALGSDNFGPKTMISRVRKVETYRPGDGMERINFSLPVIDLPKGRYTVVLGSEVGVGKGIVLRGGESVITKPAQLDTYFIVDGGVLQKEVQISYVPGQDKSEISMKVV